MMLLFLLSACSAGAPAESSESPAEAAELTEKDTAPEETGETAADSAGQKEEDQTGMFDFDSKTVLLNSGYTMPIMGLGTYALDHDTCVNSVMALLESGGRLIDTAYM